MTNTSWLGSWCQSMRARNLVSRVAMSLWVLIRIYILGIGMTISTRPGLRLLHYCSYFPRHQLICFPCWALRLLSNLISSVVFSYVDLWTGESTYKLRVTAILCNPNVHQIGNYTFPNSEALDRLHHCNLPILLRYPIPLTGLEPLGKTMQFSTNYNSSGA